MRTSSGQQRPATYPRLLLDLRNAAWHRVSSHNRTTAAESESPVTQRTEMSV